MRELKPFEQSLSGTKLIEASAGTGKTYNISSLFVRILIERPVTVDQILVMTFTKAATKELKDRLLQRVRESIDALKTGKHKGDSFLSELLEHVVHREPAINKLAQALHSFDEAAIYTIHGFCQQVLQQHAFRSGAQYDVEMIGDDDELVQELIDDYWRRTVADASTQPTRLVLLKSLVNAGITPEKLNEELGKVYNSTYKQVRPDLPEVDWETHISSLQQCFDKLKQLWNSDKQKIKSLVAYDGLNGNRYKTANIPKWNRKMEHFLNDGGLSLDLFDKFEKYTQSYLDESFNKSADPFSHPFFEKADLYQKAVDELPNYEIEFKLRLLNWIKQELPKRKESIGVFSYHDQLTKVQKALQGDRGQQLAQVLRQRYPVALVDEYQDTDPVQYDIFQTIYNGGTEDTTFFMIGDPKQSIYGFRGADIYSYLRARNEIDGMQLFSLSYNYRSTPQLIRALNTLWGESETPFIIKDIKFKAVQAGHNEDTYGQLKEGKKRVSPVQFRNLSRQESEQKKKGVARPLAAKDTAQEIVRLLQGGRDDSILIDDKPVTGKDIAVLVGTHKQADLVRNALQKRDVKSVQNSDRSVFDSDEAQQLSYVLKAVASPTNQGAIKAALATPLFGYEPAELVFDDQNGQQWLNVLERFSAWHNRWEGVGFSAMIGQMMKQEGVAEQLAGLRDGERRLTNIMHLAELLQEQDQRGEGMRSLIKWLHQKRDEDKTTAEEEQMRLESDEDLVKICTIHASKGLEFPIVFCPFLWDGPSIRDMGRALEYREDGQAVIDFSGKDDPERTEKRQMHQYEQLAETMRWAYVAMTRAKHRCYLTWIYAKSCEYSSLGGLLYGPQEAVTALNTKIAKTASAISLDHQGANETISQLCTAYPSLFSESKKEGKAEQASLSFQDSSAGIIHQARQFERSTPLPAGEVISSFTSLVRSLQTDTDEPDYDQFAFTTTESDQSDSSRKNMFTFPKGARSGRCLHKIFEYADFEQENYFREIVATQLSNDGFRDDWIGTVEQMLMTTVHKPLLQQKNDLKLASLKPEQQIREMEFYYASSQIRTEQLLSIIRTEPNGVRAPDGDTASGFLKGFIDLTFEYDGKYYLLDYKSNYLGDRVDDYAPSILYDEIKQASYDLQYHIYTIALHRFLELKLPNYDYDRDFGGVFYLFLRGINEDNQHGIFFDKPKKSTIERLNQYLLTNDDDE